MDDKYFEALKNSVPNSEQSTINVSNGSRQAYLTVKVDIDCKLYCDGDFLDLFEANRVKKISIEVGQHLMTIESEHCDGISEDHVVDAAEVGKNYLLLVNDLKQKEKERIILEQQKEPYAVLSNNNKTLIFYFDNQKESREGKSLNQVLFDRSDHGDGSYTVHFYNNDVQTIIFDDSFSKCHSIYTTASWFENKSDLISIKGLNNLITENVTDMSNMFEGCSSLQSLDLSNFNTENVEDMSNMFEGCSSLRSLDLSNFNTENVEYMSYMFRGCSSLRSLDLSNFDTRNVTDMYEMFASCNSLQKLDLSKFDTRNVKSMNAMFWECYSLLELDIRGFNMDKVEDSGSMFKGVNEKIIRR